MPTWDQLNQTWDSDTDTWDGTSNTWVAAKGRTIRVDEETSGVNVFPPLPRFYKDPSATLDYTYDWSAWLETDTIASVNWTIPAGIKTLSNLQPNSTHTTTLATALLSAGVAGRTYKLTCTITTAVGRIDERSFELVIQGK